VSFSGEKRGGCGENIGGCGEKVENSGEKCKFAGEKKLYHFSHTPTISGGGMYPRSLGVLILEVFLSDCQSRFLEPQVEGAKAYLVVAFSYPQDVVVKSPDVYPFVISPLAQHP
jgi:hypothetical protein